MQRKLLRIAGFYGMLFATCGAFLAGCVEEPTIEPVKTMYTSTRLVNVCVDQPAVDIWIDNQKFGDIPYKGYVDYTDIRSGSRFVRVTQVGADTSESLLSGEVSFRSLTQTTMVVYGRSNVLTPTDSGRINILTTQERFTYSDETAKLPPDSGKIKLINCVVMHLPNVKFGAMQIRDTMTVADTLVSHINIQNVSPPPASASEPPNLSAYAKYYVGDHRMAVWAGPKFAPKSGTAFPGPWIQTVEKRYYTFIATGVFNDQSTWDVIRLTDR